MIKSIMGPKIFFTFVLFLGLEAKENPVIRCMEMVKFENEFDSIIKLAGEERLNLFCTNMTNFVRCTNKAIQDELGLSLKEVANHPILNGTPTGKALTLLANIEEFVEEICTEGTQMHEEYMTNTQCFQGSNMNVPVKQCESQAIAAFQIFREIQTDRKQGDLVDECVTAAYNLGCLGAAVYEECGDEAFNRYKSFIKRLGFFRSGICSAELMRILKTTFIKSLNMSDSRKKLYRQIFEMTKKRK